MSLKSCEIFVPVSRQRGFTLIEVMVTVVVLAIGLLGLAGLQATSLRFNSSAYQRSQATNLAYDMADRMRVNRQAAVADPGDYDNVPIVNPPPDCTSPNLSGSLANQDIQAWRNALACTLPFGTGSICRGTLDNDGDCTLSNPADNVFTIRVQWDDSRGQELPQRFDMMTEL